MRTKRELSQILFLFIVFLLLMMTRLTTEGNAAPTSVSHSSETASAGYRLGS